MVPVNIRIRYPNQIRYLMRVGNRYHGSLFTLLWKPSKHSSRYAFVASKKVGSAVKRNRAVRLLREGVRRLTVTNQLPNQINGVFIAKPNVSGATLGVVLAELKKIGYNLLEK